MEHFDLAIIGGGPGGYVAAIAAGKKGLSVAIIEENAIGGTCLNRGCIPTKALLQSASVYQTALQASQMGVEVDNVRFDYAKIAARKDQVVKQLRMGVEALVKASGGKMISGRASLVNKNEIQISGQVPQTITADKIIIATGATPAMPPIEGLSGDKVVNSDGVLSMTQCPESVVIIGGGVIGVEFADLFVSLGKKVTIVEMMDVILPGMDNEVSLSLRKILEKKGVKIFTGAKVEKIESQDTATVHFTQNQTAMSACGDLVIVAIGRRPNTKDLGLENAGVSTQNGFVTVDERMQTSAANIYAIGDVTGKVQLAHVASAQALVAAQNIAGGNERMRYDIVPSCVYTQPEIAAMGLTEAQASQQGKKVTMAKFPVRANGKALIMNDREGFIKILADEDTHEILGAHILAPHATDLIAEIALAMQAEATLAEIAKTIHPHPTVSESIMEAAHAGLGHAIHTL